MLCDNLMTVLKYYHISELYEKMHKANVTEDEVMDLEDTILRKDIGLNDLQIKHYKKAQEFKQNAHVVLSLIHI